MKYISYSWLIAACFALVSTPAAAYVGPGPGLSMLGSFFTLIGGIILALVMVLLWPIRLLYKKIKSKNKKPESKP